MIFVTVRSCADNWLRNTIRYLESLKALTFIRSCYRDYKTTQYFELYILCRLGKIDRLRL